MLHPVKQKLIYLSDLVMGTALLTLSSSFGGCCEPPEVSADVLNSIIRPTNCTCISRRLAKPTCRARVWRDSAGQRHRVRCELPHGHGADESSVMFRLECTPGPGEFLGTSTYVQNTP